GGDPFTALTAEPPAAAGEDLFFDLAPPVAQPTATATLGVLYQEQGHHQDAERVFRDVIAQDPDNLRAQEGLAALAEAGEEATAFPAALPGDDDLEADRQRRIGVLRDYLARIQRGRGALAR
ncbi:MAG: tetratricopeptide repeat protein, partial [Thermoanaerobaculia bacterium]